MAPWSRRPAPQPQAQASDGDVVIRIRATGSPGWHYIDLYPTLYRYKDYSKTLELPFLVRYAFKIVK